VLGRDFGYDLIEQVPWRSGPRPELRAGPARRGVAPQSSYLFKHALVQGAAYGTLFARQAAGIARPRRGRILSPTLEHLGECRISGQRIREEDVAR
jgi:hypothetical protein